MNEWKNTKTIANKAGSDQPMGKGLVRVISPIASGQWALVRMALAVEQTRADFLASALISRPGIQIKKICDTVLPR